MADLTQEANQWIAEHGMAAALNQLAGGASPAVAADRFVASEPHEPQDLMQAVFAAALAAASAAVYATRPPEQQIPALTAAPTETGVPHGAYRYRFRTIFTPTRIAPGLLPRMPQYVIDVAAPLTPDQIQQMIEDIIAVQRAEYPFNAADYSARGYLEALTIGA